MPNIIRDEEHAARLLKAASRVMVVGSSGAGKTTLSQTIARLLDMPHISMDKEFFWLPGWVARDRQEQRRMIAEAMEGERWVMDGSNPSSFDLRLSRTDFVIWMRIPRIVCLLSVFLRVMKSYGRTRPDMAPGCAEQLPSREFLTYIWTFEKRHAPLFIRNFDLYGPQVPVFQVKSRRQANRLLDLLSAAH